MIFRIFLNKYLNFIQQFSEYLLKISVEYRLSAYFAFNQKSFSLKLFILSNSLSQNTLNSCICDWSSETENRTDLSVERLSKNVYNFPAKI